MQNAESLSFEYKSAPIGGQRRVVIDADSVRVFDKNGDEVDRIQLADVETARFVTWSSRYGTQRRLDLGVGEELFRLSLNGPDNMSATAPPLSVYYMTCEATLVALAAQQPELEVEWGEGSRMRWLWFALGLVALLGGIALPIVAYIANVRTEKILGGLIPAGILCFFGWAICATFRPWHPAPRIPVELMAEAFRDMRTPESPEATDASDDNE